MISDVVDSELEGVDASIMKTLIIILNGISQTNYNTIVVVDYKQCFNFFLCITMLLGSIKINDVHIIIMIILCA
jgi:hypothetical protein